ncbi:unnamed protein product [Arabidopsis halleri]
MPISDCRFQIPISDLFELHKPSSKCVLVIFSTPKLVISWILKSISQFQN